jgi:hypothetical protein
MAGCVYFDAGARKSGAIRLQQRFSQKCDLDILCQRMWRNHQAVSDLGSLRGFLPVGGWRAFRREMRACAGDMATSKGLMALWRSARIRRRRDELASVVPRLLLTAHDLTPIAPADCHETTQNLGNETWNEWVDKVCLGPEAEPRRLGVERRQNLPQPVPRCSTTALREHVYLILLLRRDSDRGAVSSRFARAVDRHEYWTIATMAIILCQNRSPAELSVEDNLEDLGRGECPGQALPHPEQVKDTGRLDVAIVGPAGLGIRWGQHSRMPKKLRGMTSAPAWSDGSMQLMRQRARSLVAFPRSVAPRGAVGRICGTGQPSTHMGRR